MYLDRHRPTCPRGYGMTRVQLRRAGRTQMSFYELECCQPLPVQDGILDENPTTHFTDWTSGPVSWLPEPLEPPRDPWAKELSPREMSCRRDGNGVLHSFQLQRHESGNKFRYYFTCQKNGTRFSHEVPKSLHTSKLWSRLRTIFSSIGIWA